MSDTRFDKLMEMVGSSYNAFHIELNINDVFGWACAESGELSVFDVKDVFPLYEKYGSAALVAYEVLRRENKEQPAHGYHKDPKYLLAKAELEELAKDGTILFEQYYYKKMKEQGK